MKPAEDEGEEVVVIDCGVERTMLSLCAAAFCTCTACKQKVKLKPSAGNGHTQSTVVYSNTEAPLYWQGSI